MDKKNTVPTPKLRPSLVPCAALIRGITKPVLRASGVQNASFVWFAAGFRSQNWIVTRLLRKSLFFASCKGLKIPDRTHISGLCF